MIAIAALKVALVIHSLGNPIALEEQRINIPSYQQAHWTIQSQPNSDNLKGNFYYSIASTIELQNPKKSEKSAQTSQQTYERTSEASEYTAIWDHRIKITDALLVVFTGFLVFGTFGLVLVGHRQDSTTKQQNRAFLDISAIVLRDRGVQWDARTGKPKITQKYLGNINAYIEIRNSGHTPAYRVRHLAIIDVRPAKEDEKVVPPSHVPEISMSYIVPGNGTNKTVVRPTRLTRDEIAAVNVGTSAIYIFGTILYRDAFGIERYTHYKRRWTGQYPFPSHNGGTFCDSGNDAS